MFCDVSVRLLRTSDPVRSSDVDTLRSKEEVERKGKIFAFGLFIADLDKNRVSHHHYRSSIKAQ